MKYFIWIIVDQLSQLLSSIVHYHHQNHHHEGENDNKEVEELNLTNYWCSGWDELLHLVESISSRKKEESISIESDEEKEEQQQMDWFARDKDFSFDHRSVWSSLDEGKNGCCSHWRVIEKKSKEENEGRIVIDYPVCFFLSFVRSFVGLFVCCFLPELYSCW